MSPAFDPRQDIRTRHIPQAHWSLGSIEPWPRLGDATTTVMMSREVCEQVEGAEGCRAYCNRARGGIGREGECSSQGWLGEGRHILDHNNHIADVRIRVSLI